MAEIQKKVNLNRMKVEGAPFPLQIRDHRRRRRFIPLYQRDFDLNHADMAHPRLSFDWCYRYP